MSNMGQQATLQNTSKSIYHQNESALQTRSLQTTDAIPFGASDSAESFKSAKRKRLLWQLWSLPGFILHANLGRSWGPSCWGWVSELLGDYRAPCFCWTHLLVPQVWTYLFQHFYWNCSSQAKLGMLLLYSSSRHATMHVPPAQTEEGLAALVIENLETK